MDLLTSSELAEMLHVSPTTVRRWRDEGTGPRWTQLPGARRVLYKRADVERWYELCGRSTRQRVA